VLHSAEGALREPYDNDAQTVVADLSVPMQSAAKLSAAAAPPFRLPLPAATGGGEGDQRAMLLQAPARPSRPAAAAAAVSGAAGSDAAQQRMGMGWAGVMERGFGEGGAWI